MKVCHLCGDTYTDHVEFCFNDGEVLAVAEATGIPNALGAPAGEDPPAPRQIQGAQGAWPDGTPVPVPRSPNRGAGSSATAPAPTVAEEGAPTTPAEPLPDAPVPAENQPRPAPTPEAPAEPSAPAPVPEPAGEETAPVASAAARAEDSAPDERTEPVPTGGLVVPPPSIKTPSSEAATPVPPSTFGSSPITQAGSQAATPILPDLRTATPMGLTAASAVTPAPRPTPAPRGPTPVDAELARVTPAPKAPLTPAPRRSTPPNVRVVSGSETDSSNLLWLGAMFAVGVLFALVGGSIPLLYMVYSGSWSGSPDAPHAPGTELQPTEAPSPAPPTEVVEAAPAPSEPTGASVWFDVKPEMAEIDIEEVDGQRVTAHVGEASDGPESFLLPAAAAVKLKVSLPSCKTAYRTWPQDADTTDPTKPTIRVKLDCSETSARPTPKPTVEDEAAAAWKREPAPVPVAAPAPAPAPAPVQNVKVTIAGTGEAFVDGSSVGMMPVAPVITVGRHVCGRRTTTTNEIESVACTASIDPSKPPIDGNPVGYVIKLDQLLTP
jgi:hypothetical protein